MSKRPWMPLYIADYLADTGHLTTAEHGAYLLLIMHYWTNRGLPENEEHIRKITKLSKPAWLRSRGVVSSFFYNSWHHRRLDSELSQVLEKSNVNSANAKLSHKSRRRFADVSQTHSHSHTDTDTESKKDGADAPPDPSADERGLFERGKQVLGSEAGGLIAKLLRAKGGNVSLARSVIELAATKLVPREYVGAAISRGPPAGPIDQAKATRDAKWENMRAALRQSIDRDREGEGTGGAVLRLLP